MSPFTFRAVTVSGRGVSVGHDARTIAPHVMILTFGEGTRFLAHVYSRLSFQVSEEPKYFHIELLSRVFNEGGHEPLCNTTAILLFRHWAVFE